MDVSLTDRQNDIIGEIAQEEGFSDFELATKPGTVKGDNYLGVITTVSIKNHQKRLDLILKSALTNEELRKRAPIREAYLREIYLYERVLPGFIKFQKEQGLLDGFSSYPKIYASSEKEPDECLIFENLREQGYKVWNRRVPMNEDHIALVFAEYGKFHAISLAMKEKKPDLYEKLTENISAHVFEKLIGEEEGVKMMEAVLDNGFKVVKGVPVASESFEKFAAEVPQLLFESIREPEEKLVVIHGDCWCNNMMFKYADPQDSKKPTDLRILDWQISSTGSPVMDLAYFFFVCSPKEILLDYKKYLKIYYDSVCKSLKGLSCDPETVFPFSLLEYHWKKYAKYGLYIALMLIKLMLGDVEEVPDMTEIAESGKSFADGFNFDSVHNSDYNQRITDIVLMMAENDLI